MMKFIDQKFKANLPSVSIEIFQVKTLSYGCTVRFFLLLFIDIIVFTKLQESFDFSNPKQ